MSATWNLLWAILAIWLSSYLAHQSEPTWTNVLWVLAVWFIWDLISVTWRWIRA